MRNTIGEAYEANVHFVKSLSEVRAISPRTRPGRDGGGGQGSRAGEFNIPIEQVVEAKYQAIKQSVYHRGPTNGRFAGVAEATKSAWWIWERPLKL